MPKKDRDYEKILKSLKKTEETIKNINKNAKKLGAEADAAKQMLKDRVGQKDCAVIKEAADTIVKVTKGGDEQIKELERSIKKEKKDFETL